MCNTITHINYYLPMGHSFNTKKTKATFEHPFSDSQISMHFSGLEHATSFVNKILAAIPVVTDRNSVLPFCLSQTEQVNQSSVSH